MLKKRLEEIAYNAIAMHEQDLELYHDEGEAHSILLQDLDITELEYQQIMNKGE